jgi:hypothetical protein
MGSVILRVLGTNNVTPWSRLFLAKLRVIVTEIVKKPAEIHLT